MKRLAITVLLLSVVLLVANALTAPGKAAAPSREEAVVEFSETVKLMGVLLRGEYLIVHDEERMAKGEPCTYVYRRKEGRPGKLVVSFHCEHVDREVAKQFTVKIIPRRTAFGVPEVREIQFAGSAAGHRVPPA